MKKVNKKSEKLSPEERAAKMKKSVSDNMSHVKYKFLVLSGKGGVGKSTVATNIAITLATQGFGVGLMDADIHGPNIPKMLGIENKRFQTYGEGLLPVCALQNLKVMSIAFLLKSKDDAVIWRGPLKHQIIGQFLGDVSWGVLDYLIVDLPPGTGDEALSVAHLIKDVDGAIIVTTPQDVALLDSRKAITFARELKIPLIGIVENMSGLTCPYCHKSIDLFKKGGGEKAAREMQVPFLGRIPIEPEIVNRGDNGIPLTASTEYPEITQAFEGICKKWNDLLEEKEIRKKQSTPLEKCENE
jgi:Mrp family chromosome partitioning ATPase